MKFHPSQPGFMKFKPMKLLSKQKRLLMWHMRTPARTLEPCPELPTSLGLGGRSATMIGRMPRVACTAQRGFIGVAHLPTIGQCVITAHNTDSRFDDLCDGGVLAAAPAGRRPHARQQEL